MAAARGEGADAPLHVLIDVVHPADVLFFYNPIRRLRERGHRVSIASRTKDVTLELLAELGLEHVPVSRAGSSLPGLCRELVSRDIRLYRLARRLRPDVLCGFGGVAASHVGRLTGRPSVGFYDTDRAVLQQRLTLPFITRQYVTPMYDGPTAGARTRRLPGLKELSYLHPRDFQADAARAQRAGLAAGQRNVLLRVVGWTANHDIGRSGWSAAYLRALVAHLSTCAQVHVSSERALPDDLEALRYRGGAADFHHLLAHCDLCVGESATLTAEAVTLGVPAVYGVDDRRSYVEHLAGLGLARIVTDSDPAVLRQACDALMGPDRGAWASAHAVWIERQPALADFVADAIIDVARGHDDAVAVGGDARG